MGVISGNWDGKKCMALAKHEYKLVLVNEILMAVNCPLLQHADNIIKKSLRSMFSDKKQSWTRVGIFFAYLRILRTLFCPNQLKILKCGRYCLFNNTYLGK